MHKVFKIGSKVEITRIDKRTWEEKDTQYISKISDINDEYFYIFTPIKEGVYVTFYIDEVVRIYRTTKEGVWMVEGIVTDRIREPEYLIKVKVISEIRKIQRRMFFRLPVSLDILVKLFNEKEQEFTEGKLIRALTKDISGGGICFWTNAVFNVNDLILIKMKIENEELILKANILRKERLENKIFRHEYACKFVDAPKTQVEKIVRYIFKEQQKILKKGLISKE